jgi:competence protein ComEA
MFGRQPPIDPSVVEAARRRLDALRVERSQESPASPTGSPPPEVEPRGEIGRHAARPDSMADRLSARLFDTLPIRVRGRAGIASQHLTVLALLIAAVVALAAWWVLRSQPHPVAPPALSSRPMPGIGLTTPSGIASQVDVTSSSVGVTPPGIAATGTPTTGRVVVDVAGKVRHPGIVALPAGSRVIDAIRAAGGVRPQVDLSSINLARLLVDAEQILVGVPPAATSYPYPGVPTTTSTTSPVLINLNTATEPELETLPGVGPVTAAAILQWRAEHGSYTSVDELLEIDGIGDATLADLAPLVTV